jgi:hypothetical protein
MFAGLKVATMNTLIPKTLRKLVDVLEVDLRANCYCLHLVNPRADFIVLSNCWSIDLECSIIRTISLNLRPHPFHPLRFRERASQRFHLGWFVERL